MRSGSGRERGLRAGPAVWLGAGWERAEAPEALPESTVTVPSTVPVGPGGGVGMEDDPAPAPQAASRRVAASARRGAAGWRPAAPLRGSTLEVLMDLPPWGLDLVPSDVGGPDAGRVGDGGHGDAAVVVEVHEASGDALAGAC
jgi:hypothetical protein